MGGRVGVATVDKGMARDGAMKEGMMPEEVEEGTTAGQ